MKKKSEQKRKEAQKSEKSAHNFIKMGGGQRPFINLKKNRHFGTGERLSPVSRKIPKISREYCFSEKWHRARWNILPLGKTPE